MTREEMIKIKIGDSLYNKLTNSVVEMTSQWADSKNTFEDDECLSAKPYGGGEYSYAVVTIGDYDKWEHVSENMPDTIKLKILTEKFFQLEAFVYQRLR